jgi:hypothetical protein
MQIIFSRYGDRGRGRPIACPPPGGLPPRGGYPPRGYFDRLSARGGYVNGPGGYCGGFGEGPDSYGGGGLERPMLPPRGGKLPRGDCSGPKARGDYPPPRNYGGPPARGDDPPPGDYGGRSTPYPAPGGYSRGTGSYKESADDSFSGCARRYEIT